MLQITNATPKQTQTPKQYNQYITTHNHNYQAHSNTATTPLKQTSQQQATNQHKLKQNQNNT